MKYRKKPVVVDAIQWNGDNLNEVYDFIIKTAKSCCAKDDYSDLIIAYEDRRGRKFKTVIPLFGWVVREGNTFQFYQDATFRKTFEEVQKGDNKGIDWEGINKTIKEVKTIRKDFEDFDKVVKGFNYGFGAEPSKETLGAGLCITPAHIKIDNLYKGYEKTHEEVKLSDGLKEMASNKEKEYSHGKTKGIESDTFESVLDEMKELHAKKDKDYGSAFHKSFEEFGVTAGVVRLNDKMERVKSLVKNGKAEVKDESLLDSLKDAACYAVMLYVELKNKKNG